MTLRLALILFVAVTAAAPVTTNAQARYQAPDGCDLIATLRATNCVVRHVSSCPAGNVVEDYLEGRYVGRAYYSHPALFLRYERVDGYVAGHNYGSGTPDPDAALFPGQTFTYHRAVYRSEGADEPGDDGTEVLNVGKRVIATIGGRNYPVLDLVFEVTAEGYRYRERALLLREPALTLGVTAASYSEDGEVDESYSTIPEAISLKGDPDLGFFEPAPSCSPSS